MILDWRSFKCKTNSSFVVFSPWIQKFRIHSPFLPQLIYEKKEKLVNILSFTF